MPGPGPRRIRGGTTGTVTRATAPVSCVLRWWCATPARAHVGVVVRVPSHLSPAINAGIVCDPTAYVHAAVERSPTPAASPPSVAAPPLSLACPARPGHQHLSVPRREPLSQPRYAQLGPRRPSCQCCFMKRSPTWVTEETFRLANKIGKAVVIETMAVSCPLCTGQQRGRRRRGQTRLPAAAVRPAA